MCLGDNLLVDDVADASAETFTTVPTHDAVEHNVEPRDRPVGATATLGELGAREEGEDVVFDGGYAAAAGFKAFLLGLQGAFQSDLDAAGIQAENVAAYITRMPVGDAEVDFDDLIEVWADTSESFSPENKAVRIR